MAISEFQLALFGAGGAVVAAVWGYNAWQDRRHRRTAERLFKGEQDDVLLKDIPSGETADVAVSERIEPVLEPVPVAEPQHRIEPQFEPVQEAPVVPPVLPPVVPPAVPAVEPAAMPVVEAVVEAPAAPAAPAAPQAPIAQQAAVAAPEPAPQPAVVDDIGLHPVDTLANCVVRFVLPAAVPAAEMWAAQAGWSAAIPRTMEWYGRTESGWLQIAAQSGGAHAEWIVALPLADRRGPVSEAEFTAFLAGLDELGRRHGANIALPDPGEALARARALDEFCASVDIQFSLQVVEASGGTFAGTKLRGVCEAAGLTLGEDGCFHALDDKGAELFRLTNLGNTSFAADSLRASTTHGVTLTLDVPRVAEGVGTFNRMVMAAQQLARGLGGVLVDAQRAPLAEAMIERIRAKIAEVQASMKAANIAPGSPRALKLFS